MTVILFWEWDNPKEVDRLKRYYDFVLRDQDFWDKKMDEGIIQKTTMWTDGTGHLIVLIEFEDMTKFGNLWSDPDFIEIFVRLCRRVDNPKYRILSPSRVVKVNILCFLNVELLKLQSISVDN